MFWMRNKEEKFPKRTLVWRPVNTYVILAAIRANASFGHDVPCMVGVEANCPCAIRLSFHTVKAMLT